MTLRLTVFLLAILVLACTPTKDQSESQSEKTVYKIAFGSCGEQQKPQPVLARVVEQKPDVFVYLGDNIYSDTYSLDTLKKNYQILADKPEYKKLKAEVPILATWDDHDYGWNDSGRHYPLKKQSKEVFLNFFGIADETVKTHEGIYHSVMKEVSGKKIQFIMLDLRTFRDKLLPYNGNRKGQKGFEYELEYSPYTESDSTMLGEAQWKWIEERLKQPADIRIIGSSTQFGITHNGYEAWANFPHEQKRFVDLVKSTKANGVLVISGDVHYAEISRLKVDGLYPLFDITASGITSTWHFAAPNENRIDGPVMENHFGLLTLNFNADPEVKMEIIDATGKSRISRTVKLSELAF
ncbi:MAG TPA: alkaline phosphatase D family protein [Chryseosolibacter sp.]